jgi:general secretion pathway protein H
MRRAATSGFTFIEVMVVMAITALGAALAVPAMDAGFNSREVRRAVRQIAAAMHHCRTEAVATGRVRHLRIDPGQNAFQTDDRSRWAVLTDRALIERAEGGYESGDGSVEILFYPNGATSGADVVVVSRRDRASNRLRLVLDPLVGAVRVEDAG